MAGPTTIQRLPTGLLDMLGMQSTGASPNEIAGVVTPTVNLGDLYLWDRVRVLTANTPNIASVNPFASTVTPPQGEQWMVYGISMTTTGVVAAAAGFTAAMAINRGVSSLLWQLLQTPHPVTTGNLWASGIVWDTPIIMRPGDTLGVWVTSITGVPGVPVACSAVYAPIRI